MILFWILFLLIVFISAILAYLSMRDFGKSPQDFAQYNSLFLIRKVDALTPKLLEWLYQRTEKSGKIFSLERLFKGSESALVIYGPSKMLLELTSTLDLIELEDYARQEVEASVWEMGVKGKVGPQKESLFLDFPKLDKGEQVWYQIVLQAQKGKNSQFSCQIRVAVLSSDLKRRKKLSEALQTPKRHFVKIPQAFSTTQILDFYRKRSMVGRTYAKLTEDEIVKTWKLPKS